MTIRYFANTTSLEGTLTLRNAESGVLITLNGEDFTHEEGGEHGIPYLFVHHEQEEEDNEIKPEVKVFQDPDAGYSIEVPEGYEEVEDELIVPSAFTSFEDEDE